MTRTMGMCQAFFNYNIFISFKIKIRVECFLYKVQAFVISAFVLICISIYIYICVSVVNACNSYCDITLRKVFFNILVIFLKFLSSFVIR